MSCSAKNPKESAGEVSAASYLKIPKGLPGKFMIRRENEALKEILIQFLSALSFEIDIEPFLEKKKTITQTVNLAMTAWLKEQYDSLLLKIFEPEIYIFVTQWDDNFETNPENLKITVSNAYMTWDALEITKEVETCEKIEKGNGTLV